MTKINAVIPTVLSCAALTLAGLAYIKSNSAAYSDLSAPAPDSAQPVEVATHTVNSQSEYIKELELQISELESRIAFLEVQPTNYQNTAPTGEALEQFVFDMIEKKEQQRIQAMRESNPIYGFYEDLPEDYELKIKTDPDYAESISNELRTKVLDSSLTPAERLAAMSQLQMNMFLLNKSELAQYDFQAVDSILDMSQRMEDDKLRVQALELVARTPIVDERLSNTFVDLAEKEDNDYVRSLAAEGLLSQYYQANNDSKLQKKLAQSLLSLYEQSADAKLKNILSHLIGDERMMEELRTKAN